MAKQWVFVLLFYVDRSSWSSYFSGTYDDDRLHRSTHSKRAYWKGIEKTYLFKNLLALFIPHLDFYICNCLLDRS